LELGTCSLSSSRKPRNPYRDLPNSRDLRFERFWTEAVKNNVIKATFIYSFEDESANVGAARVAIEGYALLNRKDDEADSTQVWSMDELYILNNKIEFKEDMKISPLGGATEEAEESNEGQ
jgi:hypothetical protein